jgi:sensor histidine kinase YesM
MSGTEADKLREESMAGGNWRDKVRKLSIRTKLIIFMTALIVMTSLVNLYFYYRAYIAMDEFNAMLRDYTRVNSLSMQLVQGRNYLEEYITTRERAAKDAFLDYRRRVDRLALEIDSKNATLETYLWSKSIRNSLAAYDEKAAQLLEAEPGSADFSSEYAALKSISTYLESYIKQLLDTKLTEGEWYHQRLNQRVGFIRLLNLGSVIGITVFSLLGVLILSRSITEPLRKLAHFSSNIAKGNFKTEKLPLDFSEDINILAVAFNKMAQSIEQMIQEITSKSDLERKLHEEEYKNLKISDQLTEAKFLALQSQINPHFLFNTLNAIMRLAMFERARKTTELIEALARIFRYNLGHANREVPLGEELAIVREYLNIQQTRFGDRIQFSLVCRADIAQVTIPRLTLQPLVENAIVHGLEPKERGGAVRVKITAGDGVTLIKVIDNGTGIPLAKLRQLLTGEGEAGRHQGHTTGIGLNNVKERIELFSKEAGAFRIWSKPELGTVVILRLRRMEAPACINC